MLSSFLIGVGIGVGIILVMIGMAMAAHIIFFSQAVEEDNDMFPCNRKTETPKRA